MSERLDPYCYPGSGVLRNRFGIRNEDALRTVEARVASMALVVLRSTRYAGAPDEDRLKQTHSAIFGEVYEWAGAYRQGTGRMQKDRAYGYTVTYSDSRFIPGEMKRIFRELAEERFLHGLAPERFAERLAYYYGEWDAVHPFREGNSRTLRQFSADLAFYAGYSLDWSASGCSPVAADALYKARDLAVLHVDHTQLTAILRSALTPVDDSKLS